jgi:DNA processing protein
MKPKYTLLSPLDERWPSQLGDLGDQAPMDLYVLGNPNLRELTRRAVAMVGSRAATAYGEVVATELAADSAERGFTIISGGAYGIDAVCHRAALGVAGKTVAVMAGGVDRLYPPGNQRLLERIIADGGAVISELPLGTVPSRARFAARNRLIAALGEATVVVESAGRSASGSLSTARHAGVLGRPVGAVPGPVTSLCSVGCHSLIQQGLARLVANVDDVIDLAGRR